MATDPGILIIVYKGIGDVLLTTPLLRAVKKSLPDSRLYFLTRRASRKVLENNPRLSGIFFQEDRPLRAIRAAGIDIAIDFMRSTSSGFYALFSGARRRAAFNFRGARLFYNILPQKRPDNGYTVFDRLQILEPLGIPHDGPEMELAVPEANARNASAFLSGAGIKPGDFTVTLDVTSPRAHRRWHPRNFARLADFLSGEFGAKVVFLWGPGELDYVKEAMAAASGKHFLSPDFDLPDLAALFGRSSLHVGTSSAPMHLAVSQGLPTFTVYAPQNSPQSWSPPGPRHGWIQGDLDKLSFEEASARLKAHILGLKEAVR